MKACIFLADGFEEIEAVVPIDILRRAGISVDIYSIKKDLNIKGSHKIEIKADKMIGGYLGGYDVVILPGGMPGSKHLSECKELNEIIIEQNKEGKLIASICAAPALVLEPLGILQGKKATCYPGSYEGTAFTFSSDPLVYSKNIITAKGPGTAWDFALKIVEILCGQEVRDSLINATFYQ